MAGEGKPNITEIARKQRYVYLLGKVKQGKQLTSAELRELETFERKARKTISSEVISSQKQRPMTVRQQRFVDCFDGDIKAAAQKADLSYDYCRRLVTKSHILEAIQTRQETEIRPCDIAGRQERQSFWSQIMRDPGEDIKNRLRASELLGRSEADFTDNHNHSFPEGCGVLVVPGQMETEQWQQFAQRRQQSRT
ncbi:MAG: hypothetical protein JXA82_09690 [Sedimentisphaerales bacterium]|nr:hypothetical protein [Sedimentisphaerales bacterium]